ncbi:MAG: helix-turn-helix transcriptional regulator [Flavobacteriaceae bacterium]
MFSNEEIARNSGYWLDQIQNQIHYELKCYMEMKGFNRTALADDLGFTKGYISQVLNGNFNFSLHKLIDLSLAINKVPKIEFVEVSDEIKRMERNNCKIIDFNSTQKISSNNTGILMSQQFKYV